MCNLHEQGIVQEKPDPNLTPKSIKLLTKVTMGMDSQEKTINFLGTNIAAFHLRHSN